MILRQSAPARNIILKNSDLLFMKGALIYIDVIFQSVNLSQ